MDSIELAIRSKLGLDVSKKRIGEGCKRLAAIDLHG
jgi:hypothetical protein